MNKALTFALLLLAGCIVHAQSFQPRNLLCMNPSGQWIPMLVQVQPGKAQQSYQPINALGTASNGTSYPLQCDAQGNITGVVNVTTAPTGSCSQGAPGQKDATGNITTCQGPFVDGVGTWTGVAHSNLVPSGNTTTYCSVSGSLTLGHIVTVDASGNCIDGGAAPTNATNIPGWLVWEGNGTGGSPTCTSGCTLNDEVWLSSLNVPIGQILASTITRPLIIRSTGTCTIAGTISVSPNTGGQNNGNPSVSNWGGSGGGGGFGAANGAAGSLASPNQGGGGAGTSGNPGGNGNAAPGGQQGEFVSGFFGLALSAGGGQTSGLFGGSAGGAGGSGGGAAGKGGGLLVLDCQTINFTGTIDASGSNGVAGGSNTGGGGGGGGGIVILRSPNMTNSGTINVTGGTGGAIGSGTSTKGGNGANGWSSVLSQ